MHDGVILYSDLYRPDNPGKYPTIMIRTPYGRNVNAGFFGSFMTFFAHRFVERGYNVLVQDVRGRRDSEGEFRPFFNEKADGRDTIQWITEQHWFNGELGLWGPSYLGITQWTIAEVPEVKTFMPIMTAAHMRNILAPDGAIDLGLMMRWITFLDVTDGLFRKPMIPYLIDVLRARYISERATKHMPLSEADKALARREVAFYQEWLSQLDSDGQMWHEADRMVDLTTIEKPVHFVTGWYDFFLRDQLIDYEHLKMAGYPPYLTIGPWHHFNNGNGMMQGIHEGILWFDHHLKSPYNPIRKLPVQLYIMGRGEWRQCEQWPPPAAITAYYLQAGYRLALEKSIAPVVSQYIYDPAYPTPAYGGSQFHLNAGPVDNRRLEARSDVLVFTTDLLEFDVTVVGYIKLCLYVKSSLDHTDFFGRLCDVQPGGKSINICDGLFRVKPGLGEAQPDGTLYIEIDMWATAHCFQKGHRIRLQVSSGAHPHWNRNLGHDEPIATSTRLCPAQQTIYHDEAHPSALILPILSE